MCLGASRKSAVLEILLTHQSTHPRIEIVVNVQPTRVIVSKIVDIYISMRTVLLLFHNLCKRLQTAGFQYSLPQVLKCKRALLGVACCECAVCEEFSVAGINILEFAPLVL